MLQAVIRAVINVLTNEEQALGLQQPAGIGQRPRPMSKYILKGNLDFFKKIKICIFEHLLFSEIGQRN